MRVVDYTKFFVVFAIVLIFFHVHSFASENNRITYEKDIKPIMEEKCHSCHGDAAPTLEEFRRDREKYKKEGKCPRVDSYDMLMLFIKDEDMGALTKRLDDGQNLADGKPGSMNIYLGDTEEERAKTLRLFKDWIGGWDVRTKLDVKNEVEQEWFIDILDGKIYEFPEEAVNEKIKAIVDGIEAPEK